MRRLAILAATGRELAAVQSVFGLVGRIRRRRIGTFPHYTGRLNNIELHMIPTGIGYDRARVAAEAVLFAVAPDAIISTGYAGGLGPQGVGALLLSTRVQDWTHERSTNAVPADEALLAAASRAAQDAGLGCSSGPFLTVRNIVCRASEKRELAEASGAIGVDMESAAVARVAAVANIPFLSVRAISDKVGDDLPMDFNVWLSPSGSLRGIIELIQRPSVLRSLYCMKCNVDEADETLRRFFHSFVMVLPSHNFPPHSDLSVAVS
jgi:adenosylhomocysteine nucleosidase